MWGVRNRKYKNMLSLLLESFCPMKTLASVAGAQRPTTSQKVKQQLRQVLSSAANISGAV